MPIAHCTLTYSDGEVVDVQTVSFPTPKRMCELKYWYKEIRRRLKTLPEWRDQFAAGAMIDENTIIMDATHDDKSCWSIMIARKKN